MENRMKSQFSKTSLALLFLALLYPAQALENKQDKEDFKVLMEAELPEGFPQPGPLNEIVVKDYPEFRQAKVGGGNFQNVAFMRLFMHIKMNKVAMTTPVIMKLKDENKKRKDMAFIYGNTRMGKTGKKGSGVEVKDQKPRSYVSIGMKGYETQSRINKAVEKLNEWIKDNKELETDGEARLLGYNSPMVSEKRRYWEVQIPVKRTKQN